MPKSNTRACSTLLTVHGSTKQAAGEPLPPNPIQSDQERILNKLRELFCPIQWSVAPILSLHPFLHCQGAACPKHRAEPRTLQDDTFSRWVACTNQTPLTPTSLVLFTLLLPKFKKSFHLSNTLEIDRINVIFPTSQCWSCSVFLPGQLAEQWQCGNTELLWHLLVTEKCDKLHHSPRDSNGEDRPETCSEFLPEHHPRCSGSTEQEKRHCKPSASHSCHRPRLN